MDVADVSSWVNATAASVSQGDQAVEDQGLKAIEWPDAIKAIQRKLLTEKTNIRVSFMRDELLPMVKGRELSLTETLGVFKLLTKTYPRYEDRASRDAVEKVIVQLIQRDEIRGDSRLGVFEKISAWIVNEARTVSHDGQRRSFAAKDIYVLLSWTCSIYTVHIQSQMECAPSCPHYALVGALATLFDLMLSGVVPTRKSIRQSSLTKAKAALRVSSRSLSSIAAALLVQANKNKSALYLVPLLGVALDLLLMSENIDSMPPDIKANILTLYSTSILGSNTTVPTHVLAALPHALNAVCSPEDFEKVILPTVEKSLLRSPEHSFEVVSNFFATYKHSLKDGQFRALLDAILTGAKSTNPVVRSGSVNLLRVLLLHQTAPPFSEMIVKDILTLIKAGRTAGPDHRVTLHLMLALIPASSPVSSSIIEAAVPLLTKEAHAEASMTLSSSLAPHLVFLLDSNVPPPVNATSMIAKEMTSPKATLARAFYLLAGITLWQSDVTTHAFLSFVQAIYPTLETTLKMATTNPASPDVEPLLRYIALSTILGPILRSGQFDAVISKLVTPQLVGGTQSKSSAFLWDKVYMKLGTLEEHTWLLRAVDAALWFLQDEITKNQPLRLQLGMAFLHLACESEGHELRRDVLSSLERGVQRRPFLMNELIWEALTSFLENANVSPTAPEESRVSHDKRRRLAGMLLSCGAFARDVHQHTKESLVAKFIVLGHHPGICTRSTQLWISLCQKAGVDPRELINNHLDFLLETVLTASASGNSQGAHIEACQNAVKTLAFVSPADTIPRLVRQLRNDIDPATINSLTELQLGVWTTTPGTPFVDVLANNKNTSLDVKGKDRKIAEWEADLRKSLAKKKDHTLPKEDRVLLQAQLEKEDQIRTEVASLKRRMERGFAFVRGLVEAHAPEVQPYVLQIAMLLLDGVLSAKGSTLLGQSAFDAYLKLSECCSDRLESSMKWVGIATLRCLRACSVPEDLQAEPLNHLIVRLMFRLRSLSEQAPFDTATFSYAFPLLETLLMRGGAEVEENDDSLEQITLVLDIIKLHCGQFADATLPRLKTMECLIQVLRQQSALSQFASCTLIDLGVAMERNANTDEINFLLRGTLSEEVNVRGACLQALQPLNLTDMDWSPELWVATHDVDEQNATLASTLWEENGLDVLEDSVKELLGFLSHANAHVRECSPAAIARAVSIWPQSSPSVFNALEAFYREKIIAPEYDQYGMLVSDSAELTDPWPARLATARTLRLLAPYLIDDDIERLFGLLINGEALGDRVEDVRKEMLNAGVTAVDIHGARRCAGLIKVFETHLTTSSDATPSTPAADHVKEGVIILLGGTARHLEASDERMPAIIERLLDALKTPSEQVQIAVSECLAPLIKFIRPRLCSIVEQSYQSLFTSEKYAARRGAAYGLSGIIKGTGISGMKKFNVMHRLRVAVEDKNKYESRQGAMFALETLSNNLGRLLEPYITQALPLLFTCFGDSIGDVREATQDAARAIMANMTRYGVKLTLPLILKGLEEKQWRTKKGSVDLLGAMAYCSPKQLSLSLPIVVPRLTQLLTDSHAQVRAGASKSLKRFGEVISNPEIRSLVPVLLKALVDPAKTVNALTALIRTSFVHFVDQSSLAFVVPILERGLRERSTETKRKAARIVGSLASLTHSRDIGPYLSDLLPMVLAILSDPVPEARATAAKALGTLVERLGESHFPDLIPGLFKTLKTGTSGVDRQGAAQGLSEVLSSLGMEKLERLLPEIIANTQSPRSNVREGFMSLLVYLPATFGARFQPKLPTIISPVLTGLADSEEHVREAALRAGRMVVTSFSTKAIDLLLPELENGIFDAAWRIRHSSITLIGELLFKISGISGRAELEQDDVAAEVSTSSRRALLDVLGIERRNRILSALLLAQQDDESIVHQSSVHVWKTLVVNTSSTVRDILPELMHLIMLLISSDKLNQQETAERTIARLCHTLGDRILGQIIPILKKTSTFSDARMRKGACLTLSQLMESTTESQLESHDEEIIAMTRGFLVDDEDDVRSAAAKTFDVLRERFGAKAIDQIIPTLLRALTQPGKTSGAAVQALREVMLVRASAVFPLLAPLLISKPVTESNLLALRSVVTVAGNVIGAQLPAILTAFVEVLEDEEQRDQLKEVIDDCLDATFASMVDTSGLDALMSLVFDWMRHHNSERRINACHILDKFFEHPHPDSSSYYADWIQHIFALLEDRESSVRIAACHTLGAAVKLIPKDQYEPLVIPLRHSIESAGVPGVPLPGFSLPKALSPIVPIIVAGLISGSNEQREQAAYAIGDIVERTEGTTMQPYVVSVTGPLIRVATQSTTYPASVKTAILMTLITMLKKIPTSVKPFFPQLQRTFLKSISDPTSATVRTLAVQALGILMRNQPRVDPVVTELVAGIDANGDKSVAGSVILALANIVNCTGDKMGERARAACIERVIADCKTTLDDENYMKSSAMLAASLTRFPELLVPLISEQADAGTPPNPLFAHIILALFLPSEVAGYVPRRDILISLPLKSISEKLRECMSGDSLMASPAKEAKELVEALQRGDDTIVVS